MIEKRARDSAASRLAEGSTFEEAYFLPGKEVTTE